MKRRPFLSAVIASMATGFVPITASAQNLHTPTGYIRTNWSRDRYSFGSYSYVAKGAKRKDHAALAAPIDDKLFFAGEATHPNYNSTIHAAYESGQFAAEAIDANTDAESIAIIGAGISGLSAAIWLAEEGYDVTVFEARNRIGGRIWTDNSLGVPLDLGASWIHGTNGNPIADIARALNLRTTPTDDTYIVRGGDGRRIPDAQEPDWLENVTSVQHSLGADTAEINARAYWSDADYGGEEVIFPGGVAQLFKAVPSDIDIRLGDVLTHVEVKETGVRLQDRQGRAAEFDAAIVTVPLGVLKKGAIKFTPSLPKSKTNAIARLGMGVLDKVYLRYNQVFWDKDVTWIATPENGLPPGQFNQWLNLYPYIGQPVIMAFNGAQPARDLAALSDAQIVKMAQDTLQKAYPA